MLQALTGLPMSSAPHPTLTASEFFAWEAEQLDKHEFYHGEVFSMAGGTPEHALIIANVTTQLSANLAGGSCQVYSSDLAVELDAAGHFAYPDATVVCGRVEQSIHGPAATNPTLVVEVLSPSTAAWDRGGKLERYRKIPSLMAVVFVSTDRPQADAVVRDGDRWVIMDPDADGQLSLGVIGVSLDLPRLFASLDFGSDPALRPDF